MPRRFEVASGPSVFCAVLIELDGGSGKALNIQRIRLIDWTLIVIASSHPVECPFMNQWLRRIFTISELTLLIRNQLEQGFSGIWVEGEVSNLRAPASGHVYFTLKDQTSQIRAVLFRAGAQRLRFSLREGLHVIVQGRLTVYEPRGEYQADVDYLEPKGIGALQIALEQLKEKLAREGLFDLVRKRPLPLLPRRVGLVTSLSGAAIRDMLSILQRRCPYLSILIVPVPVQGMGAALQIASAVRELGSSGKVDVMIVGRGGGSLEDLWSFNEEAVVRAIAESAVPVVSAVGHEIDYTLADLAADYRAPTPSAAAEAVAPIVEDLLRMLRELWARQNEAYGLGLDWLIIELQATVEVCRSSCFKSNVASNISMTSGIA
jgi:exodeoxyribonuclease VII large subunit